MSHFDKCPNCSKPKHLESMDCPYCGIVYKKFDSNQADDGPKLLADLNLLERWENILGDYKNLASHEVFIQEALAKKNLAYASQQYRKMLETNPNDDIAKTMQEKIIQLASLSFLSTKRELDQPKRSYAKMIFSFLAAVTFIGGLVTKMKVLMLLSLVFIALLFLPLILKKIADKQA